MLLELIFGLHFQRPSKKIVSNILRTEKLHEQRQLNRRLRLFYQDKLEIETNNRNVLQEKLELLQKNLDIENPPPPSPDSAITKTLEEHYQERVKKLEQEIEFLKKKYVDFW